MPLCFGHVCQTPFASAAAAADIVPGGEARPTVQVRRKTNVFIAGLFSFPKSGKTGPFHPGQGERGNYPCILLMHVSQEMKPSLHPSDASLTQEANVLASIGCKLPHDRLWDPSTASQHSLRFFLNSRAFPWTNQQPKHQDSGSWHCQDARSLHIGGGLVMV